MRIFSRSQQIYGGAIVAVVVGALSLQWLVAQTPLELPPGQSTGARTPDFTGGVPLLAGAMAVQDAGSQAGYSSERVFTILTSDEEGQQFPASRVYFYSMEPGAANPKRMGLDVNAGGFGGEMGAMDGGYGAMGGSMGASGMPPGVAAAENNKSWPVMFALVSADNQAGYEESAKPTRATIKVAVSTPPYPTAEGEMMGTEGMSGMPGSPGMGMGLSGEGGSVLVAIDTTEAALVKRLPGLLKTIAPQERTNIAQLIRLDVWIEDARTALRAKRNDQKAFAATEAHLKKLLTEEYEALLAKQRGDAERLRKRLEQLQADVERRAQAKDRVVEVQLGKLVLEAQGLLDSQR